MKTLLAGALLLTIVTLPSGPASAGLVADRCVIDAGGSADACRCVERELTATTNARLAPIVQAFASGRADEARALIQDLGPSDRAALQDTLPRALPDANTRCGATWQPRPAT